MNIRLDLHKPSWGFQVQLQFVVRYYSDISTLTELTSDQQTDTGWKETQK